MALNNRKSYFETSSYADKFAEILRTFLGKPGWTKKKLYEEFVKVEKAIPSYATFLNWLKKIEDERTKRARAILAEVKNVNSLTDEQLMHTALKGSLALGNAVIQQTVQDAKIILEKGEALPETMKKTIMDWFFKSADAHNKSKLIKIKANQGELLETIVDNLMTAAQYGKLRKKDDIIDGEFEEDKIKGELTAETKKLYEGKHN